MDPELILQFFALLREFGIWTIVQVVIGSIIATGIVWWTREINWPWRRYTKKERRKQAKVRWEKIEARKTRWKQVNWKGKSLEEKQIQQACWDDVRAFIVWTSVFILLMTVTWGGEGVREAQRRVAFEISLGTALLGAARNWKDADQLSKTKLVRQHGIEPCSDLWISFKQSVDQSQCYKRAQMGACENESLEFARCINEAGWAIKVCEERDTECWPLHGRCKNRRIRLGIDTDVPLQECEERKVESERVHWMCQKEILRQYGREIEDRWTATKIKFDAFDTYRVCALARGYSMATCRNRECLRIRLPKAKCEDEIREWAEQYERPLIPECVAEEIEHKKDSRETRRLLGESWEPLI